MAFRPLIAERNKRGLSPGPLGTHQSLRFSYILVAMNAIARLAISICLFSIFAPSLANAQTVSEPSFEVVSIHPSGPETRRWSYKESSDRVALTGANARTLVADAYGKRPPNVLAVASINSKNMM